MRMALILLSEDENNIDNDTKVSQNEDDSCTDWHAVVMIHTRGSK